MTMVMVMVEAIVVVMEIMVEAMVEAMEVMVMVMAEAILVAMKILSVNILGFILQLDAIGFEMKSQSPFSNFLI